MKQPSLTRNDLAPTHRTGLITQSSRLQSSWPQSNPTGYIPATEQLATERPATEQPAANLPSLRTRRSRRLLWPKRQAARSLCRGAAGQARTTAAGQFSCADMKLSAAQVFGREDEDEALTTGRRRRHHHRLTVCAAATIAATTAALATASPLQPSPPPPPRTLPARVAGSEGTLTIGSATVQPKWSRCQRLAPVSPKVRTTLQQRCSRGQRWGSTLCLKTGLLESQNVQFSRCAT